MAMPSRSRSRRPWMPWVRVALVALLVSGAGYGALELSHRYLACRS